MLLIVKLVVLSMIPFPPIYSAPGKVHLLEIWQSLLAIVTVELFVTSNFPVTWIPFPPLLFAVTVELLIVKLPADRPWLPLLEKSTNEFINSKCEPFEPLPVLFITFMFEFSAFTTNVPVKPERLWSEVNVESIKLILYPPLPPSHSKASWL